MRTTQSTPTLASSLLLLSSLYFSNAATVEKRALAVPATLPGAWAYQGCYTDIGRTLTAGGYTDDTLMTIETCISYCSSKGMQYAGLEYYHECYCGSSIAATAAKVAESDCNAPCAGNATEPCGGGSRLSMFYSSAPVGPQPNPGVNGFGYVGCYTEGTTGRALTYGAGGIPGDQMTVSKCTAACKTAGYTMAGVEYSGECYCDNSIANGATIATDNGCTMLCNGNSSEICGGPSRLNVYDFNKPAVSSSSTKVSTSTSSTKVSTSTSTSSTKVSTSSTSISSTKASTSSTSISTSTSKASTSSASTTSTKPTTTSATSTKPTTSSTSSTSTKPTTSSTSSSISSTSSTSSTSTKPTTSSTSSSISSTSSTSSTSTKPTTSSTSSSISSTSSASSTSTLPTTSSSSSSSTSISSTIKVLSTTSSSSSVAPTPTGPTQPATVNGFTWYGCQTEATGVRALGAATFASDTMTLEACQAFCSGYTYFGVEYARECYCGNTFGQGSIPAPAADCSFLCSGSQFEFCGAGNRLSVYTKNGGTQSSSSSSSVVVPTSSTSSSKVPTGTTTSSISTSTTATGTGFPAGWSYQGCYVDGANGRILSYQAPDSQTLTQQSCATLCANAGYTISGTEWSQQCFCGNNIINGGVKGTEADCNSPCSGNSQQMCGAGGRMSIVSNGLPTVVLPPAVQTGGLNGSWAYQGCYEDNVNQQKTFFWQLFFPNTMTANQCLSRCADYGYMAAGLEYGQECYCGDPANIAFSGSTKRPELECNVICAGNSSAYCGGGSRLSTYFWTGTPFYSWDFPTDYRAGQYQFLIGGVTIPLMTMETITGKVSFISKWGTGKANETGAYELDLSQIDNFQQAWRPLHLKTDVFCAAGLILPDKGGRQLTIGGWSGDSTEGVRLYWPDGQPGTWGTHDWQENVNELSLQVGRWYPSAMVMANGSVLVIGGEVGSNGAAVPSIEVLPYTGTKPVYMDWLDRTNPNNLYPFVAVLPSGGIFVAYWNEARILDESTFATTKTLPNAPGAVNDDLGGRTYPLEGSSVLLPQRAPYTELLTVLMCGGSTNGVSNALDNCVSTQPDSPNPTWTLERMPSFRVMPCMAPLPDGTYLIANGAKHGVAGFGLALNPNLNALLYDPTKQAGSRITVMANTTIARMYHSEAITLLDGRVLISGSNPEDDINPEEYRVEVFIPPYLLNGKPRPTFAIDNNQWAYGKSYTFTIGAAPVNGALTVTLLGAVGSTHGNSMGARTLMPAVTCVGTVCTVTAPPNKYICPPGWYQFFVLDGGVPAVGKYVRIGGDPAGLGNWPNYPDFTVPGV